MKKILIISFSAIRSDPRVMRQLRLLEHDWDVTVAGYGDAPDARVHFIPIVKPGTPKLVKVWWALKLMAGAFQHYYWNQYHVQSALSQLREHGADVAIANDLSALPLALRLAGGTPVLYDAHEYSPREQEDQWVWRLLFARYSDWTCRRYLRAASAMTTVCQGIADEYQRVYGVRVGVVHNAPSRQALAPAPVAPGHIRMIHHGVASRVRHLEGMIDLMRHLDDRFSLDLMLVNVEPAYMAFLRERAERDPRIRFIAPVPMAEICQRINGYDVGLYLLKPSNFNDAHALPNKFFEFVQARLAVAIGPSAEMARLVKAHGFGVVAESFEPEDLARELQKLDADRIRTLKQAADRAAAVLCFERDAQLLRAEVQRLAAT
ncbi:MAG: glycosyltransferase [Burkholderiaceae bacterium]